MERRASPAALAAAEQQRRAAALTPLFLGWRRPAQLLAGCRFPPVYYVLLVLASGAGQVQLRREKWVWPQLRGQAPTLTGRDLFDMCINPPLLLAVGWLW